MLTHTKKDQLPPRLPGHKALRRGRSSAPGAVYFLTATTAGRVPVFENFHGAVATARAFQCDATLRSSKLLSWVLMPDHAHWLVELGCDEQLDQLVKRLKGTSALRCNQALGRRGKLWAPGFMDQAIRNEDDIVNFARYIVANPLRAKLVESVSDYPFWDAVWL